jgi:hypothetical protein
MTTTQNAAMQQELSRQGWLLEVFFLYLKSDVFLKKEPEMQLEVLKAMEQALL